jgi:hypothetical protein
MVVRYDELEQVDPTVYGEATPFPHVVLDGLFDAELLRAAAAEFPALGVMEDQFDAPLELKSAESRWAHFGPATRTIIAELNSGTFVEQLERISGISGLVTDASLFGGGQHQIGPGGFLGVHADFTVHPRLGLFRRMNALVYLNEDWDDAYGGHLELWDKDHAAKVVAPTIGTVVIFTTTNGAMHGHPHPLTCPPDRSRRSLATYYYTAESADPTEMPRSTLFKEREASRYRRSLLHLRKAARTAISG